MIEEMEERWLGWCFSGHADVISGFGRPFSLPGETLSCEGKLSFCVDALKRGKGGNGLVGSKRALDALVVYPGDHVERVELFGERIDSDSYSCARYRKCLWSANAAKVLFAFGKWCTVKAYERKEEWGERVVPPPFECSIIQPGFAAVMPANDAARDMALWAAKRVTSGVWSSVWEHAKLAGEELWDIQNTELERRLMELAPEGYKE